MKGKWKRRLLWLAGVLLGMALALTAVVWSGAADEWARRAVVRQIEKMTGGRVELKEFHFRVLDLQVRMKDFTIHGRETEGMRPFFHADELFVDVRVDSFFGRKVSLDEVRLERPSVHVRMNADGSSNAPKPQTTGPPGKPWRERIFALVIRKLRIHDGEFLFNNVRTPMVAEGGQFDFSLDYDAPSPEKARYLGQFAWQKMVLAARRYMPFSSDVKVRFALGGDSFELGEFQWKLPQSQVSAGAALASFSKPEWKFRYDVKLSLLDLKQILRKPNSPGGTVHSRGEGSWAGGELLLNGTYTAREISMPYQWFHTTGMESRGSIRVARRKLVIPDFQATVLGGRIRGRVQMDFDGVKFRVDSRAEGLRLAQVLNAVNNPSFPMDTLHWNGDVTIDSVTTWSRDFQHIASRGRTVWAPTGEIQPGELPVSAAIDYDYQQARRSVALRQSEIITPASRLKMDGVLGAENSALEVGLNSKDITEWDDLINRLRGRDAEPVLIAGSAEWRGRVLGELGAPAFEGRAAGRKVSYGRLRWDEVEGDVVYSPEELRLRNFRAARGGSSAGLELFLDLTQWSFLPENAWSLEANFVRAGAGELLDLLGWTYPVRGLLTARLHGGGTRADPELAGPFELAELEGYGFRAERARGEFALREDELCLSKVDLTDPAGQVRGSLLYRMEAREVEFDATGWAILLEKIGVLQSPQLPLGGRASFSIRGRGPVAAPEAEGTLALADLRVSGELIGSLEGKLQSKGRDAQLELTSRMNGANLQGRLRMRLAGNYPIEGDLELTRFNLVPFLKPALRPELAGQSIVGGRFLLSGDAARPETLAVQADISEIKFEYQGLKFENAGPLRLAYRKEEIRIEQAQIRGPETDLNLSGFARFTARRAVDLRMSGSVNLKILGGFIPDLEARGTAQVSASIEGTLSRPRIVGGLRLKEAQANYGDFPTGLSNLTGDFVFDTNRMVFEGVTAEAGGGKLVLGGTVTYGEGPLRYDLNLQATRVRVRYPLGTHWLSDGTLRLAGTLQGGLLSGRVQVHRAFLGEGFDMAGLMVASSSGPAKGPATTSEYLRHLQFDISAVTAPGALLEISAGRFEAEASLRVRGTGERPVFLGNIHLISGEMRFRGNRYQLTRGDINFQNPLEFNPNLDIEATTSVQQYDVTVNFSGKASKLTLSYRSDPPLPPNDIITLLALGRTTEETELRSGSGAAGSAGANALLSEAISSQLGGRIERLFGISRFRFDPIVGASSGTSTSAQSLGRITIEQQVQRDLVITYSTDVNSTEQQVIQVEYNVNRGVSILGLRDKNGTFALEVKFKKRFQ